MAEDSIEVKRNYPIVEHNLLAQQSFTTKKSRGASLTLTEEKALAFIVSRITPDTKPEQPLVFSISDFCKVCGLKTGNQYTFIRTMFNKGLFCRRFWYKDENGREYSWPYFDETMLDEGNDTGHVIINKKLTPYFMNLSKNFFQFSFHNILAMKTVHGIQLYKLLKSLYFKSNDGNICFDLESIKGYLDCTGRYEDIKDFKKRVIKPAVDDINKYSDLEVDVEYRKKGRRIAEIVFHVFDLGKCSTPVEMEEAHKRYENANKVLNRDQITFDDFLNGIGDYP